MSIIIEKEPFIFEDGNTYYFEIETRKYSNSFYDLFVYTREEITHVKNSFFGLGKQIITKEIVFKKINESASLVSIKLNTNEVKNVIKDTLISKQIHSKLKDWDGFVGDIPDSFKKSLGREAKLNELFK